MADTSWRHLSESHSKGAPTASRESAWNFTSSHHDSPVPMTCNSTCFSIFAHETRAHSFRSVVRPVNWTESFQPPGLKKSMGH